MQDTLMRRVSKILFKLLAYPSPAIQVPAQGAALSNVTVVNPGQARLARQTLIVEGDQITHISPSTSQGDGYGGYADGYANSYILPGLIDMHVHIPPSSRELINIMFLAHGVTSIRETGDADGTTFEGRRRIQAGLVPGPRVFASGAVLDGNPPFLPTSWVVRNASEAQAAVAALAAQGADLIKVHHKLSAEALAGIRQAAAAKGLPLAGHIPTAVSFEAAGIGDVQHLDGLVPYPQPPETPLDYQIKWRDLTPAQIDAYVKISVEQGLAHTPTLVSGFALTQMSDPAWTDAPAVKLLPRHYRDAVWSKESMPLFSRFSDEVLAIMKQAAARNLEVTYHLHQARVRLHLGTDTAGMPFVVPGASLHKELELMVEAGLSLQDAWQAGTHAAGESLGVAQLGSVQQGAPADLLIFAQDPTLNLAALSTLKGVIAQGRLYTTEFLDQALARHRQCFERPLYDRLTTAFFRLMLKLMTSTTPKN